MYTYMVVYSNK